MNKNYENADRRKCYGAILRSGSALCVAVFAVTALLLSPIFAAAQSSPSVNVSGIVTDQSTGEAIIGASVYVKGSSTGIAITDATGKYDINISSSVENPVLVFSYLGYSTQEIPWTDKARQIDVALAPDTQVLDEVVVVGYGVQAKSDITGAVSSISRTRLEEIPVASTTQLLQGAVAGLNFSTNSSSSDPDNDNIMLVRGRGSIAAENNPLIVVDGVPFNGTLSDISASDIESFNVLKDASAVAIYGSRAANGVFIITTKQGRKGKPLVRYDVSYTISDVSNFPRLFSVEEYANYKGLQKNNPADFDPDDPETWDLTAYESETLDMIRNGTYDYKSWSSLILRKGSSQRHNLSVSGGSDNTNYNVSAYYLDTKGIVRGDDYKRANFRANLTTDISKYFKFNFSATYSYTDKSGQTPNFADAFNKSPLYRPLNPDGSINISPGGPTELRVINPLEQTLYDDLDKTYAGTISPNLTVKVPWVKGLSYKLNTSFQFALNDRASYIPSDTRVGAGRSGVSQVSDVIKYSSLIENIITYDRTFGKKHKLFITAMQGIEQKQVKTNGMDAYGFETDMLSWFGASSASYQKAFIPTAPSSAAAENYYATANMMSYMFRANYGYDERYLLTYTARYDGSSVFGQNRKWALFQAVSVAWNISNENFFAPLRKTINTLKLRASFGGNGNQAIRSYQSLPILDNTNPLISGEGNTGAVDYINGGQGAPGLRVTSLGNPTLSWESMRSYNIGLDFELLNNRISGDINLYRNFSHELLLDRSISSVHGVSKVVSNIGKTLNEGIELTLNSVNINQKGFVWSTGFTYAYNRNKILDLYGDGSNDIDNKWFLDHPINSNYDYLITGTWQSDEAVLAGKYGALPGYAKYDDYDGNGQYTPEDKQIIGTPEPKIIMSLTNTFSYKNFSLSVLLYGVLGTTKSNSYYDNKWYIQRDFWTPTNPTNKFWSASSEANAYADGRNAKPMRYENADFLRVKNITLSYDMDKKLLARTHFISSANFYISVANPWTITGFGGLDPELGDGRNIPLYRELTFGVKLAF